jgi:hypothetical protein
MKKAPNNDLDDSRNILESFKVMFFLETTKLTIISKYWKLFH